MTSKVLKLHAGERGYGVSPDDIDGVLMIAHINAHRKSLILGESSPIHALTTDHLITKLAELHGWSVEFVTKENKDNAGTN